MPNRTITRAALFVGAALFIYGFIAVTFIGGDRLNFLTLALFIVLVGTAVTVALPAYILFRYAPRLYRAVRDR